MVQDVNEYSPEWTTSRDDAESDDDDDDDDTDADTDEDEENATPATLSVTIDEGQILEQVQLTKYHRSIHLFFRHKVILCSRRAAPSVEAHHCVSDPNTGKNSGRRQIKK